MEIKDLKKITAEALNTARHRYLEKRKWNPGWQVDMQMGLLRAWVIEYVWNKANDRYPGTTLPGSDPAERVVRRLRELGVGEEHIQERAGSYRVRLVNLQFRIYRDRNVLRARPWIPGGQMIVSNINAPPGMFADFLILLDGQMPSLNKGLAEVAGEIRDLENQERQRKLAMKMATTTVDSLVREYLDPLGLEVEYSVGVDSRVRMEIRRTLSMTLDVPLDQLVGILSDPESVLRSLEEEIVPPENDLID